MFVSLDDVLRSNAICGAFNEPYQRFYRLMFMGATPGVPLVLVDDVESALPESVIIPKSRRFLCE